MSELRDIITAVSGVVTVAAVTIGALLVALDMRLRRQQIEEGHSRRFAAIDVSIDVGLYPLGRVADARRWLVETRVDVKNVGSLEWCIPLAYVSARSACLPGRQEIAAMALNEASFERLESCGDVSIPVNIADLPLGIFQPSIGHTTHLFRWDGVDDAWLSRFPVVTFLVTVFAAPPSLLGFYPKGSFGSLRFEWLNYLRSLDDGEPGKHRRIPVKRTDHPIGDDIHRGQRVLLLPDGGEVDIENTRRFREVLERVGRNDGGW